jgi:DNA polymerase III subunit gamma/tau
VRERPNRAVSNTAVLQGTVGSNPTSSATNGRPVSGRPFVVLASRRNGVVWGGGTVNGVSYQSLYRRFRPQTFGELQGQEHVAGALRNAVRNETVSHAYLFSGPRGTGKTSSARILAKALNCTNLLDGEPCCECNSCLQVVAGSSMDVIEMDAASNNGVEAMRDLVGRAALGTAGRRKVYIVDEVHMLSTAASNALLKTLEEPPDHVVFVLATTDPQKVLQTIISRTQHFEFRLASLDTLNDHLKSVAASAGIELDADTMLAVARRGNGSFRDALSVLDQVATLGHIDGSGGNLEVVISALADRDAAQVLASIGALVDEGRDPRQLVRDLISLLRECFLSLLAPAMAGQGDHGARYAASAADLGRRLGTPMTVRSIEVLGEAGVSMRDAIDPRTTLEVALVKLVRPDLESSASAIMVRLDRLEAVATLPAVVPPAHIPIASQSPVGRADSTAADSSPLATVTPITQSGITQSVSAASVDVEATREPTDPTPMPTSAPPVLRAVPNPTPIAPVLAQPPGGKSGPQGARAALAQSKGPQGNRGATPSPAPASVSASSSIGGASESAAGDASATVSGGPGSSGGGDLGVLKDAFMAAIESRMTKAMFNAGRFTAVSEESATFALPNEMTLNRCLDRLADVTPALHSALGRPVGLNLVVDQGAAPEPLDPEGGKSPAGTVVKSSPLRDAMANPAPVVVPRVLPEEHEVDVSELSDAPSVSPVDVILNAFPGAEIVDQE